MFPCDKQYGWVGERRPVTKIWPSYTNATAEKFADPLYGCLAKGFAYLPDPAVPRDWQEWSWLGKWNGSGYEYLRSALPNAAARIAAVQARVSASTRHRPSFIASLAVASQSARDTMAEAIHARYIYGLVDLAKSVGAEAAAKEAVAYKKALGVFGGSPDALIVALLQGKAPTLPGIPGVDTAAMMGRVVGAVGAIARSVADTLSKTSAIAGAVSSLGNFGAAVPIIGTVVKTAIDLYMADMAGRAAKAGALCNAFLADEINVPLRSALTDGFPTIWNVVDSIGSPPCPGDGTIPRHWHSTSNALQRLERDMRCLDTPLRVAIKRWWAFARLHMADPRVARVFSGTDFATWANDEQVYQVAVPIAVAHGLDVDAFARRLYDESAGWQGRKDQLFSDVPAGVRAAGATDDMWIACAGNPTNANVVQYAVLALDAFKLADQMSVESDIVRAVKGRIASWDPVTKRFLTEAEMRARAPAPAVPTARAPAPAVPTARATGAALALSAGAVSLLILPPPFSFVGAGLALIMALRSPSAPKTRAKAAR